MSQAAASGQFAAMHRGRVYYCRVIGAHWCLVTDTGRTVVQLAGARNQAAAVARALTWLDQHGIGRAA